MPVHIYERLFAGDNAFTVPAGEAYKTFVLDLPPAGIVKKLIVRQKSGTSTNFTVNLYNQQVTAIHEPGYSLSEEPPDVPPALAKVIPEQSATAGNVVSLISDDGYAYRNMEGSFSVPVRRLYLEINPAVSAGDTEWEVAIAVEPAVVN